MRTHETTFPIPASLAAGTLLALTHASAHAAALELPLASPPRDLILLGSMALLTVALALRVSRRRHEDAADPQRPDLRWWKNGAA